MKSTEVFKRSIQHYLDQTASMNAAFAEKLNNPKKNIDDCVTYILNQVQKSGKSGFEDSEVYGLALHYYDEENIDPGKPITGVQVVVNEEVKLTPEEIEDLKEKARQKVLEEEMAKLRKKPAKAAAPKPEEKGETGTLFD